MFVKSGSGFCGNGMIAELHFAFLGRRLCAAPYAFVCQGASRPAARIFVRRALNCVSKVFWVALATAAAGVTVPAGPIGPVGPAGPTGPGAPVAPAAPAAPAGPLGPWQL